MYFTYEITTNSQPPICYSGDIAPMMNEEEHVLPFDDTNPPGRLRSSPEHRQPTDEYAEPPVLQGKNLFFFYQQLIFSITANIFRFS